MKKFTGLVCLIVVIMLLVSCGGKASETVKNNDTLWSGAGRDSLRTGRADGDVLPPFGALYVQRINGLGISSSSVARVNVKLSKDTPPENTQVVFVSGGENAVMAIVAETGNILWGVNLPAKPHAPVCQDGKVVLTSEDGLIQCLSAENGYEKWTLKYITTAEELSYEVAEPVISGGNVFFGFSNGLVLALNLEDGKEIWRKKLGDRINSSPVVVEGKLIVADYSNKISAYEAHKGEEIWNVTVSEPTIAPLTSDGNTVFVCGAFGKVSAINISDGELLWGTSLGESIFHTPCITDGKLFIPTTEGNLFGLNISSGEELLKIETEVASTGIISAGNLLLFSTENGTMQSVNLETKQVSTAYEFATWEEGVAGQKFGDLAVVSGKVFASDGQSKFFCLVPKDIAVQTHSINTEEVEEE